MRAELKHLQSNDYLRWEDFVAAPRPEPWNGSGWFSVEIGSEGDKGSELFQFLFVTPAAASSAKPDRGEFRHLTVETFEPEVIASTLREHIASISSRSWEEIRERLRQSMWWEHEDINVA